VRYKTNYTPKDNNNNIKVRVQPRFYEADNLTIFDDIAQSNC